jgi:chromosome segregation ATPase
MSLSIREKIFQAADQLYADTGKTPSIRQVLNETGGSSSTVQKYLRDWQELQAQRAQSPGFPLPVQQALNAAWDDVLVAAQTSFDEERNNYAASISSLEDQLAASTAEVSALDTKLSASTQHCSALSEQLAAEQQQGREQRLQLQDIANQLTAAREQYASAALQIQQLQQHLEDAQATHIQAIGTLQDTHGQELDRLREMVDRSENHLLREIDRLRELAKDAERRHTQALSSQQAAADSREKALREQLTVQSQELQEAHADFIRADALREQLEKRCGSLSVQLADLYSKLEAVQAERHMLAERLHQVLKEESP